MFQFGHLWRLLKVLYLSWRLLKVLYLSWRLLKSFSHPVTPTRRFTCHASLFLNIAKLRKYVFVTLYDTYSSPKPYTFAVHPKKLVTQFYNLFYASSPGAVRIEPVLDGHFASFPPVCIPRFNKYVLSSLFSGHNVFTLLCVHKWRFLI